MASQDPSRRDVFRVAGVASATMAVTGGACGVAKPRVSGDMPAIPDEAVASREYALSLGHFTPHVGSTFVFRDDGGAAVPLTLVEARDTAAAARGAFDTSETFALGFASVDGARASSALAQGTYAVSHGGLGSFSLFVVPGALAAARTYTAVFNRV